MHVRGYADDCEGGAVAPLKALSYGVLTGEILMIQSLADDCDRGRVATIIKREVAARNESRCPWHESSPELTSEFSASENHLVLHVRGEIQFDAYHSAADGSLQQRR